MIGLMMFFLVSLAIVSCYFPKYRIVKYENFTKTWFTVQESGIFWLLYHDLEYVISPYSGRKYMFDTYDEAKTFLNSLDNHKVKKTVMK